MTYEETQKWLESANVCKNCKHALRRSNFTGGYNWCGWECLASKIIDDYKRLDESCEKFEKRSPTEKNARGSK